MNEPTVALKRGVADLAIRGGRPLFSEPLHVGRPNLGKRPALFNRISDMLDRRWLTNHGPYVQEFESAVSERLGVRHCVAVCNATVGLEVLIRALGLTGEVIVPAYTFVATAHALRWLGLTPVFADVRPEDHNIDPDSVEACLTERTSAILGVHLWGRGADVQRLQAIADGHRIQLAFDAAHAFDCAYQGRMIGGFGVAEVFSFHATKFVNAFEGGAITTNDDDLARRLRLMVNFGFAGYDRVESEGTNAKMSEPCAAMGLTSLESIDEFVSRNVVNHQAYLAGLEDLPGVRVLHYNEGQRSNHQYVVVEIDDERAGIDRDTVHRILQAENVLARRYFFPGVHRMEPYASDRRYQDVRVPVTERLCKQALVLPTGTSLDEEAVAAIGGLIRLCVERASELHEA